MVPKLLRMDKGRENIYCEDLQTFLTGDPFSFLYAASTRNQRFEVLWSRLKKYRLQWWKDFFKNMVDMNFYRPKLETHQECLLFVFLPVIQVEINDFMRTWNMRSIRQSSSDPGGRPDILFDFPSTVDYTKQGKTLDKRDLKIAEDLLGVDKLSVLKNSDIHELLQCYVQINCLKLPSDAESGIGIYAKLIEYLENDNIVF